jgi:hypothetical protein
MSKGTNVKPATLFIKSDHVLLFILGLIILITALLLTFIAVICVCNRLKRQCGHKSRRRSESKRAVYQPGGSSQPSDDAASHDLDTLAAAKRTKKLRLKRVDLNASSTSNSSGGSSSGHGKPQYMLVNATGSSTSSSSSQAGNGTLVYRDPDFDEFGLNPSSIQLVNKADRYVKRILSLYFMPP